MRLFSKLVNWRSAPIELKSQLEPRQRVQYQIDLKNIWASSEQADLVLPAEALGSLFIIPAHRFQRDLLLDRADIQWLGNAKRLSELICDWWGYEPIKIDARTVIDRPLQGPSEATGLAFSLGVDSFYSCFFLNPRPKVLILAGGFDVSWQDRKTLGVMFAAVKEVAQAIGATAITVNTNLLEHYLIRRTGWERTYGGAVAFLGHLLTERLGILAISSGMYRKQLVPHGSHPDLDPLWSGSGLKVRHFGDEVTRLGKLRAILGDEVARGLFLRFVRVCWERPAEAGNCGYCTKCLLVRLSLLRLGCNEVPKTMPASRPLVEIVDQLPPLSDPASVDYRKELLGFEDRMLDRALKNYIERSEAFIAQNQKH